MLPFLLGASSGLTLPRAPAAAPCRRSSLITCAQQTRAQLDADAQALLDEAGGDAMKARASYIGYTLAYLEDAEPELYAALKTDPSREDCHAAIVEITWDAIAAFLPVTHDPVPTPAAQKKLAAIARAGCDGASPAPATLDVGCGNGLLLPFLAASGAPPAKYRGIDLSGRMVEVAKKALAKKVALEPSFEGAAFDELSLKEVAAEETRSAGGRYDAIFFNAALQFFRPSEARATSAAASAAGAAPARPATPRLHLTRTSPRSRRRSRWRPSFWRPARTRASSSRTCRCAISPDPPRGCPTLWRASSPWPPG